MPISHLWSARLALPVSQPCRHWLRPAVHCSYALCSRFNALHESRGDHRVTVLIPKQGAHLHPFCLQEHFFKGLSCFLFCSNVQGDSQTSICITIEPGLLLKGDILVRKSTEFVVIVFLQGAGGCGPVFLWNSCPTAGNFLSFFVFSSSNQILLLPLYNANVSRGCLLLRSVRAKARP